MSAALYSLDEARPMSRRAQLAAGVGIVLYLGASVAATTLGGDLWPSLNWVPIAHALVLAVVCGLTSLLLYGHARVVGRRGYLWLGGTYLYVAVLLLSFPLFHPGTFGEDQLLGGRQSGPWMYYIWHFALLGGLSASVWVFHIDRITHRRPRLAADQRPTVLAVALAALGTVVVVAVRDSVLRPTLLQGEPGQNTLGVTLDWLLLTISLVAVVASLWWQRGGASIQRWLSAVLVLELGAAIVNLNSPKWSFSWFFDRLFGMAALTGLLMVLVYSLARAGQATSMVARSDALTRSENRASFMESLDQEVNWAQSVRQSVALLWVDLDGFKAVNDQFGHQAGDDVLRTAVQRIAGQVRSGDHVGRLGGDEIGVLLCDGVREDRVIAVGERILTALRAPMYVDELAVHLTGSIGVATFPTDGTRPTELITRADLAMYAAKNAGGDRCLQFSSELGAEAMHRAQLRHDLARAVLDGDFELVYQPIVSIDTGEVIGVEQLARWRHDGHLVPAGEFVDFAEVTGQIVGIGRQVLRLVEEQLDEVLATLPGQAFLSVNISARELADEEHLDRLLNGRLRAASSRVVLELTESAELLDKASLTHRLTRLRSAGYRLAVDDFGAGFSSFSRLQALRPHVLKVDRSLVSRAGSSAEDGQAFLSAVRSVADSLHCQIIAEGVETTAERDGVLAAGITLAQGYLLGRPLPLPELAGVVEGGAASAQRRAARQNSSATGSG